VAVAAAVAPRLPLRQEAPLLEAAEAPLHGVQEYVSSFPRGESMLILSLYRPFTPLAKLLLTVRMSGFIDTCTIDSLASRWTPLDRQVVDSGRYPWGLWYASLSLS